MRNRHSGFSIIEIAVVLVAGSAMIAGYSALMTTKMRSNDLAVTQTRLVAVQDALETYIEKNNALPCPASLTAAVNTVEFGRLGDCAATTGDVMGYDGTSPVRIGALPVRDLNLPDSYIADGWQDKFIYAITKNQFTAYDQLQGHIDIVDAAGTTVLASGAGTAPYVIVSAGANQKGAYSLTAAQAPSDAANCSDNAAEKKNCDLTDAVFGMDAMAATAGASEGTDDVIYFPVNVISNPLPPNIILPFDSDTCPSSGWTDEIEHNGMNVRGRVLMNTGAGVPYMEEHTFPTLPPIDLCNAIPDPQEQEECLDNSNNDPAPPPPNVQMVSVTPHYVLGDTGGMMQETLSVEELPSHQHTLIDLVPYYYGETLVTHTSQPHFFVSPNPNLGGNYKTYNTNFLNKPHENMMPYKAFLYCKKL